MAGVRPLQRVSGSAQEVHTIGWAVPGKGLAALPGSPRGDRPPKWIRRHVFAGLGPLSCTCCPRAQGTVRRRTRTAIRRELALG